MHSEILSLAESTEMQPNAVQGYFSLALIFLIATGWHWYRRGGIFIVLAAFLSIVCLMAAVVGLLR